MLKSFRIVGVAVVFLILGWTIPANARQGHEDKPAGQEQPQAKAQPQQQQRAPQQQAQKQPQQQRAPQQQAKAQPQQQKQVAQPKQQAQQQTRPATQPQQQAARPAAQQSQPQAASSQRPQRTQQAMASQRAQPALRLSARGNGRIPDDRFQSNFGRSHEFHVGNPVMVGGYSRFQYGGFWFGFVQPWPVGWYYTDDVYIDYVDGGYYMFDPYYPGQRFAISVVL